MSKAHILVVEDEFIIASDIAHKLTTAGYHVINTLATGEQAIKVAAETAPDLILMDIQLGGDIDGIQAAEHIHTYADIPILYLTTYTNDVIIQRAKTTRPFGYLLKPFHDHELFSNIEIALFKQQMNQKLAASEANYRTLFEDSPICLWHEDFSAIKITLDNLYATGISDLAEHFRTHPQTIADCAAQVKIVATNQACVRLFGAPDKPTLIQNMDTLFVDTSRHTFAEEILAFHQGQTYFEGEIVGRKINGDLMETLIQVNIVPGCHHTWEKVFISAIDITARKQAENALRASEARYRELIERMPSGVAVYRAVDEGEDFILVEFNHAAETIENIHRETLLGRRVTEAFPAIKTFGLLQVFQHVWKTGMPAHHPITFYEDEHIAGWRENYVYKLPTGEIVALYNDVTSQKQQKQERDQLLEHIQKQAQQMQHIMDTVPNGVLLLDHEHHILLCNLVANTYLATLSPQPPRPHQCALNYLGGQPITTLLTPPTQGRWHHLVHQRQHFHIAARPIAEDPTTQGWVMVIQDVTDERHIQQAAQRQQRLAAVGQLAAGIAHDFNNIIAAIVLYSQLSLRSPDLSPRLKERLEIIADQGHQAAELINQILDFSRSGELDRHPLDLRPLLKEQVKLWQRTLPENIQITLHATEQTYIVNADPTRIRQVLMNLAVNARDAMPEGGHLRIHLAHYTIASRAQAPMPDMQPGPWISIALSDTGSGIPPDILPRIYEPFFTTKAPGKGTGLGLAQVYGIVTHHEGHINVESQKSKGSTFTIYLPALAASQNPPPINVPDLPLGQQQLILVVEDNAVTRNAVVESLHSLNYRTIEAKDGRIALDIFAQERHDIALVLSDLVMPNMGGKALINALHQHAPTLPIIAMSGHPLDQEIEALRESTSIGWIQKPPNLHQLATSLAEALP